MAMEFHVFLPQMRMPLDLPSPNGREWPSRVGFQGITVDGSPGAAQALDQPMYEAMITATWLAAQTERLRIGHLVLCEAFRHPAVLARQAVTIDHASNGRFDLGIGWGSVPEELEGRSG